MLQRRSDTSRHYDAIIVGARCAGSPLATMLARSGLDICLLDRASFPSDTPSTHGIQPPGVKILDRLGVMDRLLEATSPIEDGVVAFDDLRIEVRGVARILGAPMLNLRRVTLDAILLDAAAAAGADVRTATSATGLLRTASGRVVGVETTAGPLRAPLVVGADGANSTVARLTGAAEYHRTAARRIFLWSYFEGVDPAERRVWLGGIGSHSFLASPTDAGLFLAAVVVPIERRGELRGARERGYEEVLASWPELNERLAGARRVGPVRMMSRWHGYFRESAGPGWVLLGDAGHFKDPTPGQGISDALRQAAALAPAIERSLGGEEPADEPLREWWAWRDRDAWEMYWFAQDMGAGDRAPLLQPALEARLASDPDLIENLLRVLGHEIPPSRMFTPSLMLSVLSEALREGRGQRLAIAAEARRLAVTELRRWALGASGARRPGQRRMRLLQRRLS
jgi:2-polyprenyl-6-methoxyphenol hydroxylase-like FAD-dependent oxidoreductase